MTDLAKTRWVCVAAIVCATAGMMAQSPETRVVSATSARLRAAPAADASMAAVLPLGTELTVLESQQQTERWLRVRSAEGQEGWIRADLTQPLRAESRIVVLEQLASTRLDNVKDGFAERLELLALIDRVAAGLSDADARGRFALLRLRALRRVLDTVPAAHDAGEPYRTWLKRHESSVVYHEPAGIWLVAQEEFHRAHDAARAASSADAIAWMAANEGVPGECEGYVPCHIDRANELDGQYLRTHPGGAHAAEAVARIEELVATINADLSRPADASYTLDRRTDCPDLLKALPPLRAAVAAARSGATKKAAAALDTLARRCQ